MEGISGTSTVAVIKGEKTGPCIAFRADIDALPVEEENDLPFKSEVPGVMHACGHDIHTAVLLTFAKILTAHPELVRGTVKLIFQAAEEKLPGGAKALCEEGVMKDVDLVYGFHCASAFPLGTIAVTPRAYSAAIGVYEVKIHGKGGHGGYPQNALNPVPVACMVGSALNQILAEKKNPLEGGVLTVSYINGGQYPNIITDTVTLGGNVRTLNNDLIDKVFDSIHSISRGDLRRIRPHLRCDHDSGISGSHQRAGGDRNGPQCHKRPRIYRLRAPGCPWRRGFCILSS